MKSNCWGRGEQIILAVSRVAAGLQITVPEPVYRDGDSGGAVGEVTASRGYVMRIYVNHLA